LLILPAFPASGQLPHYDIRMDSAAYLLLYNRDVFSDSVLKLTSVVYPGPQAIPRTDGWLRFKGHFTRYYPKKAYRLKFDADFLTPAGPSRSINLNAMYTDKSFIREAFCLLILISVRWRRVRRTQPQQ
jgi:hypothetical protein